MEKKICFLKISLDKPTQMSGLSVRIPLGFTFWTFCEAVNDKPVKSQRNVKMSF